jgi:DNA-directed RNA polymerase subunit H (RpoH/RPB5)
MSIIPQQLPLEINSKKRRIMVLSNIIKMLTERGLLQKDNLMKNIEKIINDDNNNDDYLYTITLDNPKLYYDSGFDSMYIKLIYQKITGITKSSIIGEFLYKYKNQPKIIVAINIVPKANLQIETSFPNTQIFLEKELLINIIEHVAVPKHELLNEKEKEALCEEYKLKKKDIPKIFITDPVAKYYNAKIGDIFRIYRPSEISGIGVYYRIVIKGNINTT